MKYLCLLYMMLYSPLLLCAQNIANLNFEPEGKTIQISYDLLDETNESYSISVFICQDGGTWEGPLRYVTGDVGEKIKSGNNKRIIWDVLKEKEKLSGNLKIKLETFLLTHARSGCMPFTVTHTAGSIAPVTKTVTYGVVETNLSGYKKCWITQNLGANRQAIYGSDATESSAGWYWQFNRKQGYKHDGTQLTPDIELTSISEDSDWSPDKDPCALLLGYGWRLPTKTEWENVDTKDNWDSQDVSFTSVLKIHPAGILRSPDASLKLRGLLGNYWSNTQNNSIQGFSLFFTSLRCITSPNFKADGFPVRCLKD